MTQTPAGWYPDPDPAAAPGSSRYWDGQAWTDQVRAAQPPAPTQPYPTQQQYPQQQYPQQQYPQQQYPPQQPYGGGPYGPTAGSGAYGGGGGSWDQGHQQARSGEGSGPPAYPYAYGQAQPPGYGAAPAAAWGGSPVPTTPDGERLAGWWHRVAAYLIDTVILVPLNLLLGWPFWAQVFSAYGDFMGQTLRAAENGTAPPDQTALIESIAGPVSGATLVSVLVLLVYQCGFWKWKAATPGKLAVGLRIRLRERPGPLGWGTILKRWAGQNWYVVVGVVPILGTLAGIWPVLNYLWPLWDSRNQALHDKIASTNVVRTS
jgi:uncharacterized RDD family membrane protein YckC